MTPVLSRSSPPQGQRYQQAVRLVKTRYLADGQGDEILPRFEMCAGGDRLYQRATQSPELGNFIRLERANNNYSSY